MSSTASGIVLAGGRSSRFGSDKLEVLVDGRPLLDHAVAAVQEACTEVVVVLPPLAEPPSLGRPQEGRAGGPPIRFVHDAEPYGGPLVGLLAGLEHAREPLALVAAGDMPSLQPAVLSALLRVLDDPDVSLVTLRYHGRIHPLPAAMRNGTVTPAARRLLAGGTRSLMALIDDLQARIIDEDDWRGLDPSARTLRDIDRPEDLA
jgi:molybdopterin-guanine dinucleotide biosynthesis protein A